MYLPNGELSRAILIGTSDFQSSELLGLPAVNNNLFALYQALADARSGILPEDHCEIVQNPDSPDSLMQRLRRTSDVAEDLLVVYYAGHGLRHERRDDLYLTVRQTDPRGLDGTAVQFDWVRDVIADCPARTRLLILDCCYSGLALGRMSGAGVDAHELEVTGTSVLASSPRNKRSHSPDGERYTAFTGELISLLRDGPSLAERELTVYQTYQSIKAGLAKRDLPQPVLRSDNSSGQVLLRRRPLPPEPIKRPSPEAEPVVRPNTPTLDPLPMVSAAIVDQPATTPTPPPAFPIRSSNRDSRDPRVASGALAQVSRSTAAGIGKVLLWWFFIFGNSMFIGGLVGVIFGPMESKAGDAAVSLAGFVIMLGPLLLFARRTRRRFGSALSWRTGFSEALPMFFRWPSALLAVLASLSELLALAMVLSPGVPASRRGLYSQIALPATVALVFVEVGLLFVQALFRAHRNRRQSAADSREIG